MRKRSVIASSWVAVAMVLPLRADETSYRIDFTADSGLWQELPSENLVVPTGSFTYDPVTDLFSNFTVNLGSMTFLFPNDAFPSPFTSIEDGPCSGTVSPIMTLLSHTLPESCSAPQPSQVPPTSGFFVPDTQDYFWQYWDDSAWIFRFGAGPYATVAMPGYVSIHGNVQLANGFNRDGVYGYVDPDYQGPHVYPEVGTFSITRLPEPETIPLLLFGGLLVAFAATYSSRGRMGRRQNSGHHSS